MAAVRHDTSAAAAGSGKKKSMVASSVWEFLKAGPLKVAIIGSGNWGSAIAKVVGLNTQKAYFFQDEVPMYVYEEMFEGRKLHDIINERHENPKYLPGIALPRNIKADSDILRVVQGAHVLVFVMPHQFIRPLCEQIQGHVLPGAKGISLVKGFDVEGGQINLMSEFVKKTLGIECSSLSGANVAEGVAAEQFSETTIGYHQDDYESAQLFQSLFDTPWFRVNAVPDVAGVEICGALKNIIALAAGFVDGLGYGSNTKAAILRIGLYEMRKFAGMFYKDTIEETFWDSAGMADLLTTCYGGRNRRCAEAFIKTGKSWRELENSMLKGQKLQGTGTCRDVHAFLTAQGKKDEYPLMTTVYEIADCGKDPHSVVKIFMSSVPRTITKDRTPLSKL